MKKYLLIILIILLIPLAGEAVEIGDTIELIATNQQGVPLHRAPFPSIYDYAPDRSRARVIDMAKEGQWLLIELNDSQTGWISSKYVAGRVSSAHKEQFAGEKVSSTINYKDQPIVTAQGDFNKDGYTDLAIGAPYKDGGTVKILYGSAKGLRKKRAPLLSQDTPGIKGESERGDRFGYALATADFNNDGFADLAIGAPYEDLNNKTDAGAVNILYGSASGLTENGNQLFSQDTPGIKGEAENGDLFGYVLTTGDFNNDGFADLVVGVPYEDGGTVNILYGSANGLTAPRGHSRDRTRDDWWKRKW